MTRKKDTSGGFGKSFLKDQKRQMAAKQAEWDKARAIQEQTAEFAGRSVLEQCSLDDLIATVQMRKDEWDECFGETEIVQEGPVMIDLTTPLIDQEHAAAKSRDLVSIPRRPKWNDGMTVEELAVLEHEAFQEWRRGLKDLEEEGGLVMTPYERNLDFWRQLWRCMERSDLLVQVLDARDPDFYFCQDLYTYVSELGGNKRLMLLINKSDYLTQEQRQLWADYFQQKGVDVLFFSALKELEKLAQANKISADATDEVDEEADTGNASDAAPDAAPDADNTSTSKEADTEASTDAANIPVPDSSDDELSESKPQSKGQKKDDDELSDSGVAAPQGLLRYDDTDWLADVPKLLEEIRKRLPKNKNTNADAGADDTDKLGVVGFVGYPNVGKSTVINSLAGAKKVGMSRTPGKTKHIQTLHLPEWGFILCDAPGLVFPSVVATRAHLVINNTVPLEDLRECWGPIRLIVEKIGLDEICRRYNCSQFVKGAADKVGVSSLDEAHTFLAAFAISRNHFLWVGVPDEQWAARKVLRDYTRGQLLHVELPHTAASSSSAAEVSPEPAESNGGSKLMQDDDDFDDLNDVMDDMATEAASTVMGGRMTKKKERHTLKQMAKGALPNAGKSKRKNAAATGFASWGV